MYGPSKQSTRRSLTIRGGSDTRWLESGNQIDIATNQSYLDRRSSATRPLARIGRSGLILIVDDHRDIREVLKFLLVKSGYVVIEAENGSQALELLETQTPQLVITDVQMAVMDGIEFVEKVRSSAVLSELPVLVMTAQGLSVWEKAFRAGASGFIQKPIDAQSLLDRIDELLAVNDLPSSEERVWGHH